MTKLEQAIIFATQAHTGQTHLSGSPYILHPLRVMLRLKRSGAPEVAQIVGVLHDVVEDTSTPLRAIEYTFGPTTADAVDDLSRRDDESYEQFIERAQANPIARIVKIADIEDNLELAKTDPLPEQKQAKLRTRYTAALEKLKAA